MVELQLNNSASLSSWASHTEAQQHVSTRAFAPTTCRLATVEELRLRGCSRAQRDRKQQQSFSPKEPQKRVCSAQHMSPQRLCLALATLASGWTGCESNPATERDRKSQRAGVDECQNNHNSLHVPNQGVNKHLLE